jgi:hypothetical protein
VERLSALPGVRSVALSDSRPIEEGNWASDLAISGYVPAPKENMTTQLSRVSGRYFEPLLFPSSPDVPSPLRIRLPLPRLWSSAKVSLSTFSLRQM